MSKMGRPYRLIKKIQEQKEQKKSSYKPKTSTGSKEELCFSDYEKKDWLSYWQAKARQNGVKYIVGNYPKEYAIFKSLMDKFHWEEIKTMIDFLWDSNQDIHNKRTMGVWILSKGWINTIYQSSLLWMDGDYKPAKQKYSSNSKKRNREWIDDKEESSITI